jgi:hypothetical protein
MSLPTVLIIREVVFPSSHASVYGIPPSRVASLVNINLLNRKNETATGTLQIPQDSAPQNITINNRDKKLEYLLGSLETNGHYVG